MEKNKNIFWFVKNSKYLHQEMGWLWLFELTESQWSGGPKKSKWSQLKSSNNIFKEPIFQKLWSFTSVHKSGIRMELGGGLTLSLVPLEES